MNLLERIIEEELEKRMERLIDGLSHTVVDLHKKRLGFEGKILSKEDYILLLKEIRKSLEKFAGKKIADEIYQDMIKIIEKEYAG